ncbi:dehydrodolichyl diphosphate synthase complex subunit nus1-like [Apostichopus japonicus]|uniref:dehydrodolichyl diphosphate synthase complex subunit nus1-like n=1 Tax=Stichopus japonicus TaxID=307972 RepID=UPI003AB4CC41
MAFIDKVLFHIVHLVLWLYNLAVRTWPSWGKKHYVLRSQYNHRKRTLQRCLDESKSLHKIPRHLGLVFIEEKVSICDVANIVVWCAAVGVSYISVYDSEGLLQKHSQELTNLISEKEKQLLEMENLNFTIETFVRKTEASTNSHNGIKDCSGKNSKLCTTQLYILEPGDGQPTLVRAAKQYCNDVIQQEEFDLNKWLQATHSFPDPELIFKFGTISSLLGYLPWQIRLTEIISYPSHHGFDYKSLLDLLHVFARTEQRFGK